ncbi:acetylornithine deacetylase [bacterium]|nr:acetylornithine deacetylase [bacterium]
MNSTQILERLISFDTISSNSNLELISYCEKLLKNAGAEITIIQNKAGTKSNLFATIGPSDKPGVILSGHTDVVPVKEQSWKTNPFKLIEKNNKLYGRGTADMKSFVACALYAASKASSMNLKTPLHFSFSYDEEIGCVGVRSLIEMLKTSPLNPLFCIVGEPTSMQVMSGHKGKVNASVLIKGKEAHSALTTKGLNSIYLANELIQGIQNIQTNLINNSNHDSDFEVPYTTLQVGKIEGGVAVNIVPSSTSLLFEIRSLHSDDPNLLLQDIKNLSEKIVKSHIDKFPNTSIEIKVISHYPALNTMKNSEVISFLNGLTGNNSVEKVSFGTEGGLFSEQLNIETAICGPGSMNQGHKPNEYIEKDQIILCDKMLDNLLDKLRVGL